MNQPSRRQFLKLAGSAAALTGLAQIVGCGKDPCVIAPAAIGPAPAPQTQYVCDEEVLFFLDQNEKMDNQRQTLTSLEMPRLLQKTNIGTPLSVSQVNQYLHFGPFPTNAPLTSSVLYGPNELDQVSNFLYFKDADCIFEHQLEFENGLRSNIDTNGDLVDLIGQQIPLLGNDYRVLKAQRTVNALDLELMAGAFRSQPAFFGPQTHVVNNREYEIAVLSANINGSAQYAINGEITPMLSPGAFYALADGTGFGHVKATGTSGPSTVVDFALDADQMWLIDDDTTDGQGLPFMTRNNAIIDDAVVRINGTDLGNGVYELSSIRYQLKADSKLGDIYVAKGQSLRENNANPLSIPGKKLDIDYLGMTEQGKHAVRVCNNRMPLQQ